MTGATARMLIVLERGDHVSFNTVVSKEIEQATSQNMNFCLSSTEGKSGFASTGARRKRDHATSAMISNPETDKPYCKIWYTGSPNNETSRRNGRRMTT